MERIYLAYGSNLNRHQMAYRCPDAECIGTASIKDYRLLYKGSMSSAYLTIKRCRGHEVPVGVWKVTEDDEKSLDRYEGYPRFYYKKEVIIPGDKTAFIYIMDERLGVKGTSRQYYDICCKGYEDFGLDLQYINDALKRSLEEMER